MAENTMDMVRRFAGADPEAEDTILEMCYRAAVAWYEGAGVPEMEGDDQYLFWVCNLAAWMYDNRGNADANAAVPIYIVTSVHQLRARAKTYTADTGTGTDPADGAGTGDAGEDAGNGSAGGEG